MNFTGITLIHRHTHTLNTKTHTGHVHTDDDDDDHSTDTKMDTGLTLTQAYALRAERLTEFDVIGYRLTSQRVCYESVGGFSGDGSFSASRKS